MGDGRSVIDKVNRQRIVSLWQEQEPLPYNQINEKRLCKKQRRVYCSLFKIYSLILSNDSLLIMCSIRQASDAAVSGETPSVVIKNCEIRRCRS